MNNVKIITFGCRLNIFESEIIRQKIVKSGLENVVLINSCAITKEAERQAKQEINKILKNNPDAKIIIAGCSAQNSYQKYKESKNIFAILGNSEKLRQEYYDKLATITSTDTPICFVGDTSKTPPEMIEITSGQSLFTFDGKTKAFVQIQQGCNNRCSFCIVPFLRGKCQSFSEESILNQCDGFLKEGYKEIILTGVDISAYGTDTKDKNLFTITKKILETFPELPRFRLSSLDPAKNYDEIFNLMKKDKRILPYFHLSLQSGDNNVLYNMKRRHTREHLIDLCQKIHDVSPHISIGADTIVGFPGETDAEFENTYNLVKECNITHLHVFPYSKRAGTLAEKMPNQIDTNIKKQRARKLRELGERLKRQFIYQEKGRILSVLVENDNQGYTDNYLFVKIAGPSIPDNSIVNVKIVDINENNEIIAEPI